MCACIFIASSVNDLQHLDSNQTAYRVTGMLTQYSDVPYQQQFDIATESMPVIMILLSHFLICHVMSLLQF